MYMSGQSNYTVWENKLSLSENGTKHKEQKRTQGEDYQAATAIQIKIKNIYIYIQGVPGGKDLTSGECSLRQTIPI